MSRQILPIRSALSIQDVKIHAYNKAQQYWRKEHVCARCVQYVQEAGFAAHLTRCIQYVQEAGFTAHLTRCIQYVQEAGFAAHLTRCIQYVQEAGITAHLTRCVQYVQKAGFAVNDCPLLVGILNGRVVVV